MLVHIRPRLRALGNIIGATHDIQCDDVVAALATGYMAHKGRVSAKRYRVYFSVIILTNTQTAQGTLHDDPV